MIAKCFDRYHRIGWFLEGIIGIQALIVIPATEKFEAWAGSLVSTPNKTLFRRPDSCVRSISFKEILSLDESGFVCTQYFLEGNTEPRRTQYFLEGNTEPQRIQIR